MAKQPIKTISVAIDSRQRLVRWFDDAKRRREGARQTGTGRQVIAEIAAALHRDILGGPDRRLVHRISLPSSPSGEETVYLFPGHRAIYEIRIPKFLSRLNHFIAFTECDSPGPPQPGDPG